MHYNDGMSNQAKIYTADVLRQQVQKAMRLGGPSCSLNHINVSKITDFSGVFENLAFTGDISEWDTRSAKNMNRMFYKCPFDGDISNWDVSNVTHMALLFEGSKFNGDISKWNTQNVKFFSKMFNASEFTGDLSQWNVGSGEHFSGMFKDSLFNGDISRWDVSRATAMDTMFEASQFTGDLSAWNTVRVEDMTAMFDASPFDGDVSRWNVSRLEMASRMFAYSAFAGDVSAWRPTARLSAGEMFLGTQFNGDLSTWNVEAAYANNMVDPGFRGKLPNIVPRGELTMAQEYAALLGGPIPLSAYLRATPFSAPHFEIIMAAEKKPAWAKPNDYAWVKKQAKVGAALGLAAKELQQHCLSARRNASTAVFLSNDELADMEFLFE